MFPPSGIFFVSNLLIMKLGMTRVSKTAILKHMSSHFISFLQILVILRKSLQGQHQQQVIGINYKSSAVAEMGDRGHNRHGPKGGGVLCPFRGALGTRLIQCGLRGGLLLYQVASSSIQRFGHNSVGCHSLRRKSVRTTTLLSNCIQ